MVWSNCAVAVVDCGSPGVSKVHSFFERTTTRRLGLRGMNSEFVALQRVARSIARLLDRDRKSECAEG